MKPILPLVFSVLLLASFAGAVSISAPSSVSENSAWAFSVDLDAGAEAHVKLNDSEIVQVFSSGSVVPMNAKVISAHLYGGDLVVEYAGLSAATYTLSVESNGSDSKQITVVPILDSAKIVSDIDAKVNERLGAFDEIGQTLKNMEIDNKEFWKKANENSDSIIQLDSRVSGIDSQLSSLSGQVSGSADSLNSRVSSIDERLAKLEKTEADKEAALAAQEEANRKSPIAGFLNLVGNLTLPIALIVIVILIAGAILVVKSRLPDIGNPFGRKFDDHGLPISPDQEKMASELVGAKWKK